MNVLYSLLIVASRIEIILKVLGLGYEPVLRRQSLLKFSDDYFWHLKYHYQIFKNTLTNKLKK